jgi:hypothetical protein
LKGEISVFSLSASPNQQKAQEYPIKYNIVSERRQAYKSSSSSSDSSSNNKNNTNTATKTGENYIALTRFVAQSFYAPKRLI